ncbi:Peptidyl-tRNA hydrolase [Coniochaeta hoffmannii]|uniref:peptidyl-tRNA hydrolase n=1 Tax=Coniochaeta hoffmannii TaxID=91930 RepID=A0AA38RXA0_9PEZI|nr:Peptidyl-tRNA hydrolase [Coniochaeta hoffmannii]
MSPSRDSPVLQPRFLVVSLGNPPPNHQSYHSAGHVALSAAQQLPGSAQPDFTPQRLGKKTTQASVGSKYIFLQCPTLMNQTGPWLSKAYKDILAQEDLFPSELGVVIVHDDLEHSLGAVNVLSWKKSHQGHNGLRSVQDSLPRRSMEAPWVRIAIGIGRPVERDAKTVSEYVMSSLSERERRVLEEKAEGLLDALEELEGEWRKRTAAKY